MKITHISVSGSTLTAQPTVEETIPSGDDPSAANVSAGNTYTPSTQLQQLTDLVRQQPTIREDRVHAVGQRLRHGHYRSRASAEQTAAALMNALD